MNPDVRRASLHRFAAFLGALTGIARRGGDGRREQMLDIARRELVGFKDITTDEALVVAAPSAADVEHARLVAMQFQSDGPLGVDAAGVCIGDLLRPFHSRVRSADDQALARRALLLFAYGTLARPVLGDILSETPTAAPLGQSHALLAAEIEDVRWAEMFIMCHDAPTHPLAVVNRPSSCIIEQFSFKHTSPEQMRTHWPIPVIYSVKEYSVLKLMRLAGLPVPAHGLDILSTIAVRAAAASSSSSSMASPIVQQPSSPPVERPASPVAEQQPASPPVERPASPAAQRPASPPVERPVSPIAEQRPASPPAVRPASPVAEQRPASPPVDLPVALDGAAPMDCTPRRTPLPQPSNALPTAFPPHRSRSRSRSRERSPLRAPAVRVVRVRPVDTPRRQPDDRPPAEPRRQRERRPPVRYGAAL